MVSLNRWKVFYYIFFSICLIGAISMNISCIVQYALNKDLCVVDFKTFNDVPDDIYPSASLCINNPFVQKRLMKYGEGINATSYAEFLEGNHWDSRMLYIDYDNVTIPLLDNLIEYGVQYPNWTWVWYNKQLSYKEGWKNPYISRRSPQEKCFAIDIPYLEGKQIVTFAMKVRSDIFPKKVRPREVIRNVEGFQVLLHYPQQFVRSYFAGLGKWIWPERKPGDKKEFRMDFLIQNVDVIIRRNKPTQDDPCDMDWRNYDSNVWQNNINMAGCRHPLWTYNLNLPLCNNQEQMKQVAVPSFEDLSKYPICCRRVEKLQFDYDEIDLPRNRSMKDGWFQLNIRWGDSIYKEIMKVRKFDYQSLIGNGGGYIGLFLGCALAQLPDFGILLFRKLKDMFTCWPNEQKPASTEAQ